MSRATGDDLTAPTVAGVAGSYRATAFTVTFRSATTTDVLATGGSFTFSLARDGSVAGDVTIPTEGLDVTFAGTWKLEGDQVVIVDIPGTESFIEVLEFHVRGNRLTADEMLDAVWRMQVVMTKQ